VLQPEILNGFHMATDHGDCNCTWQRPHRKHMKRTLQSVTICAIKHRNGRDIDRKLPQCEIRCGWEPPEHSDQKWGKTSQNSTKFGQFVSLGKIRLNTLKVFTSYFFKCTLKMRKIPFLRGSLKLNQFSFRVYCQSQ